MSDAKMQRVLYSIYEAIVLGAMILRNSKLLDQGSWFKNRRWEVNRLWCYEIGMRHLMTDVLVDGFNSFANFEARSQQRENAVDSSLGTVLMIKSRDAMRLGFNTRWEIFLAWCNGFVDRIWRLSFPMCRWLKKRRRGRKRESAED